MTKKENRLIRLVFFLLGIVLGFLLAPAKHSVSVVTTGGDYLEAAPCENPKKFQGERK